MWLRTHSAKTGRKYRIYISVLIIKTSRKDIFDIVIFFARKPSFFIDRRPFWKLENEKEVESFTGWDELDTNNFYSQASL